VLADVAIGKHREEGGRKATVLSLCLMIFATVVVPFLAVLAWTAYADTLKALNPLAGGLTSASLRNWNFGTLEQKLSMGTWQMFYSRTLADLVGNSLLSAAAVAALALCRKERAMIVLMSLGLFLLTLLTFTNLQYRHSYYSYANGIFFLVAIGIIVADLLESRGYAKRAAGGILFCLIMYFSVDHFFRTYWPFQNQRFDFSQITTAVDTHSHDNDVFIVFGNNWSSEIPYYIRRRAVMIVNPELTNPSLLAMKENLKGYRIGGLIFYSRNGFDADAEVFINNAVRYWGIRPGFYSDYPWYKSNSAILIVFNRAG
jgi:hypothetical protein